MNESFGSGKVESPAEHARRMEREAKKRYEALPGARPRMFPAQELSEGNESPFAFPPKVMHVNQESIESIVNATYDETQLMYLGLQKRLDKLQMGTAVLGEYEVSYIMRAQGDMNRIDKMID